MFRTSIRNKLIFFLLIAMLIPITISIVVSYLFIRNTVYNEAEQNNTVLLFQGKTNIENYLSNLKKATLAVYNDPDLFLVLDESDTHSEDAYSWWPARNEVNRSLHSISYSVFEIRQVYLYMENRQQGFALQDKNFTLTKDPLANFTPPNAEQELYIEPPHTMHSYGLRYNVPIPKEKVFTFYRTIYNDLTKRKLGTLALDVNPGFIASLCAQLYTPGKEEVFLLDPQGRLIYAPNSEDIGKTLDSDWVGELALHQSASGHFRWNHKDFSGLIQYEKLEGAPADWTLVKRISYDQLYRSARQLTSINTAVFSICLIIAIAFMIGISLRFTNPIRRLAGYMNRIQEGHLNVDIDIKGNDELAMLGRRFRTMMQTINNLILREYRLQIANKTNELKALQAQINPHFLNNVLQSIGTVALQHNDRKVYSLIASLGKMMRYSMNTSESVVPLSEEIAYTKAYLDLQQQRFEGELDYTLSLDPDVAHVLVPKMTLQPLVENAFKHAFSLTGGHKSLAVRCYLEDKEVVIEVNDNGPGVDEEVLLKLQKEHIGGDAEDQASPAIDGSGESESTGGGGIGIANVRSRLNLLFDTKVTMELANLKPEGFSVKIWIPIRKEVRRDEGTDRG
ncbi:MAG: sensor histidine kinase [Gorillibacterium sp.]|nr:sensor histidine kinase [Gorillibacterium sp.]